MKNQIYALVLIMLLSIMIVSGCGNASNSPTSSTPSNNSTQTEINSDGTAPAQAKKEPVVITLAGEDYGYPTPYQHYSRGPGLYKMTLIFDSLVERGEQGYEPGLAKSWTASNDGTTYLFELVDNAYWHDGTKLTAADVVFSMEYFSVYPAVFNYIGSGAESIIESVSARDDYTVVVNFHQALASNFMNIGIQRIIPKHIWENVPDPITFSSPEAVIGSGPFMLVDYIKEQGAYHYKLFPDFWGTEQAVKEIKFIPVSDSLLAFNEGDIDMTAISPDLLTAYQNNSEYKLMTNPAFWGIRLLLNMEKRTELQDVNIRRALAHAIDRDDIIAKVTRGAALPGSYGYLSRSHNMYNPEVIDYEYDINKSIQLLSGQNLTFDLITGNNNAEVRVAELVKLSLEQIGITVNVRSMDFKTRDEAVKSNNYELAIFGHGGWGGDPDLLRNNFATERTSGLSPMSYAVPGFNNERINELAQKQRFETDTELRRAIVMELQAVIAEQVPVIPIYNTTGYIVFRPDHYDGWKYMFDHHVVDHNRLSFLR